MESFRTRTAFVLFLCTAWLFALALDLGVSAAGGYVLRTSAVGLVAVDAAYLLPGVALVAVLAWFALPFSPRAGLWLAASLPVAIPYALRESGFTAGGPILLAILSAGALAAFERRCTGARPGFGALCAAGIATALAFVATAVVSPPGREQLAPPSLQGGQPATETAPNLLLIVLDTMRADHLEIYGYRRPTSPWLERFAREATVYERAYASSSYTLPSHATLFTGQFTRTHGAHVSTGAEGVSLSSFGRDTDRIRVAPLGPAATTLAELMRDAGLATGAICANTGYLYRAFGLAQGFDTYVDAPPLARRFRPAGISAGMRWLPLAPATRLLNSNERYYRLAPEVNRLALEWLDVRPDERFFLFLNYMDPHGPKLPIGENRALFEGSGRPRVDAYDAETRYLDDHLAALFEALEARGALEHTLVVFVGDHGESFWEHGSFGHGLSLYEPEVRVPLVVKMPGQREGHRVGRFVHLADVLPTLLDRMGVARPAGLQGDSLSAVERTHPLVAYLGPYGRPYEERAIYDPPWKLILRSDAPAELYNVVADPLEQRDLAAREVARVEAMQRSLEAFERASPRPLAVPLPPADPDAAERLKALGYVE